MERLENLIASYVVETHKYNNWGYYFPSPNFRDMEGKPDESKEILDVRKLSLTMEDIDTIECYRHFTQEQKLELIEFVYKISSILYNTYCENDESWLF